MLLALFAWISGHNILYVYVVPVVGAAHTEFQVDVILLDFGVASVVGIGRSDGSPLGA